MDMPASSFSNKITQSSDRVQQLPGFGCLHDVELAGTLPVSRDNGLFYWFVESERHDPDTPVVLWLNGGPGSSSLYGFFLENGPYQVRPDLTLDKRLTSWIKYAHYLVIDQPVGVGLSYGKANAFANESEAMDQLSRALQMFYKRYPELQSHPLYIAGQSYAGKYIPQLALRLLNLHSSIHLKGVLIGDGWVNPLVQQSSDADFAYSHGLVDQDSQKVIRRLYQACSNAIQASSPSTPQAHVQCSKMQQFIKQVSACRHLTNIDTCREPDDQYMTAYLNQPKVRDALHVDSRVSRYSTYASVVADRLIVGEQDSVAPLFSTLLAKGLNVVIYNGLDDGTDSNFMGTDLWLSQLSWSGKHQFNAAKMCVWRMNHSLVGFAKSVAGLTQLKIRHAGHLVPADQPDVALDMLKRVIRLESFCDE